MPIAVGGSVVDVVMLPVLDPALASAGTTIGTVDELDTFDR